MTETSTSMDAVRFAPVAARCRVAVAVGLPLAVAAAVVFSTVEGGARLPVSGALVIGLLLVLARSYQLAIVLIEEGIAIRNLRRTIRLTAADVERVDDAHRPLRVVPVHAVAFSGRKGTVAATVTVGAGRQDLVDLFRIIRRWSSGRQLDNRLERIEFEHPAARARRFAEGEEVSVPCRLRRTSARGWGPWAEGWLRLSARPGGPASWRPVDPATVGMVHARAEKPVELAEAIEVERRPVRYKAEAFHGMHAEIIVFRTERSVVELTCPSSDVDDVFRHLKALGPATDPPTDPPTGDPPADSPLGSGTWRAT